MSKKAEFTRWELGIDLRKGESVSDANRLLEGINCYISHGMALKKRPGTRIDVTLEPGTKGLVAGQGYLNTFYSGDAEIVHENPLYKTHKLTRLDGSTSPIAHIHYADVFQAYFYVAAEYEDGEIFHHYLDGGERSIKNPDYVPPEEGEEEDPDNPEFIPVSGITQVTDENCPHTKEVVKVSSKIFAASVSGDTVRFSVTGDPLDWTTAEDAGFLPTGLNSTGDRVVLALGVFETNLAVLMRDSTQIWFSDPDPSAMHLESTINNVGSSFSQSLATVSNDMFFLSDYGFRSIRTQTYIDKREDVDVGSPIDDIVRPIIRATEFPLISTYYYGTGQYLCFCDDLVFVYTASKSSKISAWTLYFMPFSVSDITEYGVFLYMRSGDAVFVFDETVFTDNGQIFTVFAQMPYMDFKSSGINKYIEAVDVAGVGELDLIISPDVTMPDFNTTAPQIVLPNTAPGGRIPIPANGTEFSMAFLNQTDKDFRLDRLTVYFNQDESV